MTSEEVMSDRRGYIYCMTNKCMSGYCKIGMTTKTPEERAKQLYSTGVAHPFEVVFSKLCIDAYDEEQKVFELLEELNIERCDKREFFKCTPDQVKHLFEGGIRIPKQSIDSEAEHEDKDKDEKNEEVQVEQEQISDTSSTFQCTQCDKMFASAKALGIHAGFRLPHSILF